MQHIATLIGAGWLRTRSSGSSTARYELNVWRRNSGPQSGQLVALGKLAAELSIMIEARIAGRAVLVLSTGDPVAVELENIVADEASFAVVGSVPGF